MDDGAGGKCSHRVHLEALARAGDPEAEAELYNGPECPPAAAYLWTWWMDLTQTRGSNGFGPNPLTRHDVRAWEEDEGENLASWERRALFRIDAAWRASVAAETAKAPKKR